MKPDERPSKRDAFFAFFGEGSVFVYLDARRSGVKVPPEFAENRQLLLQYGDNMPIPIPDLVVNDEGITATLSFSRMPHRTFVPWSAVYMIERTDGHRILYYKDVPEDVAIVARPASADTGESFVPSALVELQGDDDEPREGELGEDEALGEGAELDTSTGLDVAAGETEREGAPPAGAAPDRPGKGKGGGKRPAKRAAEQRLLKSVPAEPPEAEGAGEAPAEGAAAEAPAAARRRKRPQLRVVK
jgi:stringent starvation protein B